MKAEDLLVELQKLVDKGTFLEKTQPAEPAKKLSDEDKQVLEDVVSVCDSETGLDLAEERHVNAINDILARLGIGMMAHGATHAEMNRCCKKALEKGDDAELSPEESRSVIVICIGDDENVKDQPWSKLHEPEIVGVRVDRENDDLLMSIQSKFKCYSTGPEEAKRWDPEEAKRCRKAMFEATVRKDVGFKAKPITNGVGGGELSRSKDCQSSPETQEELLRKVRLAPPKDELERTATEAERAELPVVGLQSGQIVIKFE